MIINHHPQQNDETDEEVNESGYYCGDRNNQTGEIDLADQIGAEPIQYWRTSGGNEVDFILSDGDRLKAIEVKFDINQVKRNKYKIFLETYTEIPLNFLWMNPFDQDFFKRIYGMPVLC